MGKFILEIFYFRKTPWYVFGVLSNRKLLFRQELEHIEAQIQEKKRELRDRTGEEEVVTTVQVRIRNVRVRNSFLQSSTLYLAGQTRNEETNYSL